MKKSILILLGFIFFLGCKKDSPAPYIPKAYQYITLDDIKAHEDKMLANEDINYPTPGKVIVYKTSQDTYGKLRITGVDVLNKTIAFEFINYNIDGSELLSKNNLSITFSGEFFDFDLDMGVKTLDGAISDFRWFQTGAAFLLRPVNNSKFYLYSE